MAARAAAILSAAGASLLDSLAGFTATRRTRRTAGVLRSLSEHKLKDIGLSRSDIGRATRGR